MATAHIHLEFELQHALSWWNVYLKLNQDNTSSILIFFVVDNWDCFNQCNAFCIWFELLCLQFRLEFDFLLYLHLPFIKLDVTKTSVNVLGLPLTMAVWPSKAAPWGIHICVINVWIAKPNRQRHRIQCHCLPVWTLPNLMFFACARCYTNDVGKNTVCCNICYITGYIQDYITAYITYKKLYKSLLTAYITYKKLYKSLCAYIRAYILAGGRFDIPLIW